MYKQMFKIYYYRVGPNATMNRIINGMNITTTTNKLRVFDVFEFVDKSIYKIKQTYSERL